jgi:hypothetical protein
VIRSFEAELQRVLQFLLVLFGVCHDFFLLPFLLPAFLGGLLFHPPPFGEYLFDDAAPVAVDAAGDPALDFYSWYALHAEYFESGAVAAVDGGGYAFDVFVVLAAGVLDHGVDGGELFGAFGAAEVFGFLVVVQDHLVFE